MKPVGKCAIAIFFLLGAAVLRAETTGLAVRSLALRVGATVEDDPLSGRTTLRVGGHVVHLCAGIDRALVDDRVEALPEMPYSGPDDLVLPLSAAAFVEGRLRAAARPPAVARTSKVAPSARTEAPVQALAGGRIVVDAGHGGPHTGAKGAGGTLEKSVNLDVARRLERVLTARGWDVHMTRDADAALSASVRTDLEKRAQFTQRTRPDAFVSIHANHASDRGARGFEVFVGSSGHATRHAGKSRQLAQEIERSLRGLGLPDRGVKSAGFYVIKWADCPAVLVETEFLSNSGGERFLSDAGGRQRIAEAIAEGVVRWRGLRP